LKNLGIWHLISLNSRISACWYNDVKVRTGKWVYSILKEKIHLFVSFWLERGHIMEAIFHRSHHLSFGNCVPSVLCAVGYVGDLTIIRSCSRLFTIPFPFPHLSFSFQLCYHPFYSTVYCNYARNTTSKFIIIIIFIFYFCCCSPITTHNIVRFLLS
jgi:hypothetical protein